jgi:predicted GNAT superfamily acetyltransferase
MAAEVEIRACAGIVEFARCVELQKTIWGFADADLVPVRLFVVAAKVGGQVFGAFAGSEMIGFCMAIPGYRHGEPYLHSHMAAVLPDFQNQGVGRRLKLRQREDALARGIELIEWTFDPLELKNARFNLERLGVIVRRYVRNQYGTTSSPLHGGLPTDRLVAEWWLRSARVEAVLRGEPAPHRPAAEALRVPVEIADLKKSRPAEALKIQAQIRDQFEAWFGHGYAVTGLTLDPLHGVYLLEPFHDELAHKPAGAA